MGTDEVVALAHEQPSFSRDALRKLIVDLWAGRGATLLSRKWSSAAAKADNPSVIGYALTATTRQGWIGIVESADLSVGLDATFLRRLAARTTAWVWWNCDHSALYGQQKLSKSPSSIPLDLTQARAYRRLRQEPDFEFLTFGQIPPRKFPRFGPSARTRQDPLPRDLAQELESRFGACVRKLDLDGALASLAEMPEFGDSVMRQVFDERYPIEWEETAHAVLTLGAALLERRRPNAEEAIRYLEVAAVMNDTKARDRAFAALAGLAPGPYEAAVAAALLRFEARGRRPPLARFLKWSSRPSR